MMDLDANTLKGLGWLLRGVLARYQKRHGNCPHAEVLTLSDQEDEAVQVSISEDAGGICFGCRVNLQPST